MQIGNIFIENNVTLAPMAGTSDMPYRVICSKMGASMVTTELISAKGIYYKNENTHLMLQTSKDESIKVAQIFGNDPYIMLEASKMIQELDFDILDVNMGCPAPKIVRNGEGSALMQEPKLVGKIVETLSNGLEMPVTVKIRKGFDYDHINAVEIAKICENSGAKSIAVHGRVRTQFYSGESDNDIIKAVKDSVKINVIGNGDIVDEYSAKNMLDYTKCDGIMIGRKAMGNPFIFREVNAFLKDGTILEKPSIEERIEMALAHTKALIDFKGEFIAIREMRTHLHSYTKGLKDGTNMRAKINTITEYDELESLLLSAIN